MNGSIEAGSPVKSGDSGLPSTYQTTIIPDKATMTDESTALISDASSPNNATDNGWLKKKAPWIAVVLAVSLVVLIGTLGQQQSGIPEMVSEPLGNDVPMEGGVVKKIKKVWVKESSERSSGLFANGDELYLRYVDCRFVDIHSVCKSPKDSYSTIYGDRDISWVRFASKTGLTSGSTWYVNKDLEPFCLPFCVQLWEADAGFDDDFLGYAIIDWMENTHEYPMNGGGGKFVLYTE